MSLRLAFCLVVAFPAGFAWADDSEALRQHGAIVGRVVDVDGRPVPHARVWFEGDARKILAEARTDEDGRYRLVAIPATLGGELLVEADRHGREYRADVRVFPARQVTLADVVVAPGREVIGRILDANGDPKAGFELECNF